jgi:hypothetical protein
MKFDFMEVLKQTWKIGWNHKVLWLWQLLPSLFSIAIMPFMLLGNPAFGMFLPEPWNQYANETWVMGIFMFVTFLLMIPIVFATVLAQSTTTYGALKVEKGATTLAFRELFNESLPYFWRVLGLYFIFGAAWMLLISSFMALQIFGSMLTFGLASFCFMPFFLLLFPIALAGYSVLELAQAAIIEDNMRTMDAIAHGWRLFRGNVLNVVILMVILYFALYLLSSVVIFPLMMFPMMLMPMGVESQGNFDKMMPVFLLVFFPLMFVLMSVIQAILMTFFQSAWAVAYLRLNKNIPDPTSSIEINT